MGLQRPQSGQTRSCDAASTFRSAGTALIFGGEVTHAGLPVTAGQRTVFVASFSLAAAAAAATAAGAAAAADGPDEARLRRLESTLLEQLYS